MKLSNLFVASTLLVLLAGVASAQNAAAPSEESLRDVLNQPGKTAPVADADSPLQPRGGKVQISLGQDDKRVTMALSATFGNGVQWQAKFSSPVEKDTEGTSVASLDGLANGSKAELGLSYVWFTPHPGSRQQLDAACRDARQALQQRNDLDKTTAALVDGSDCDDRLYEAAYKYPVDRRVLHSINTAYFGGHPYVYNMGLDVGAGYDSYDFLNTSFAKTSTHKTGYEVGLHASVTNVVSLWSLVASIGRERSYENNTKSLVQICAPVENTPAQHCSQGYASPPLRKDSTVAALEWRWQHSNALALAVSATYRKEDDVLGISIPIYLLSNSDGSLRGGIKLGWRNDTHDTQAGVFISSGFNL